METWYDYLRRVAKELKTIADDAEATSGRAAAAERERAAKMGQEYTDKIKALIENYSDDGAWTVCVKISTLLEDYPIAAAIRQEPK